MRARPVGIGAGVDPGPRGSTLGLSLASAEEAPATSRRPIRWYR